MEDKKMILEKLLISAGATVVDLVAFIIIMAVSNAIWGDASVDTAMKVAGVVTLIVALVTYFICDGLGLAISMIFKSFDLGMIIPIFPINFACGFILASFAIMIAWLAPCVPVVIYELKNKKRF